MRFDIWENSRTVKFAVSNPGFAASVALGLAFEIKVIAVAHGNLTTATSIVETTSLAQFASGLVLVAFPLLYLSIFGYMTHIYSDHLLVKPWSWSPTVARLLLLAVVLALVFTWASLLLVVMPITLRLIRGSLMRLATTVRRRIRRLHKAVPRQPPQSSESPTDSRGRVPLPELLGDQPGVGNDQVADNIAHISAFLIDLIVGGAILFYSATLLLSRQVWLPPQAIRLESQDRPLVGYVLDRKDSSIIVLRETDRRVLRVPVSDVLTQQYCSLTHRDNVGPSLIALMTQETSPVYPACADLEGTG